MAELKKMSSMKDRPIYVFVGEPGVGKTTLAASGSKHYDPTYSKAVSLDDQVWITMERDGFRPFVGKKIEIPYVFDLTTVSGVEFDKELKDALKQVNEMATANKVSQLIIDSGSAIDTTVSAWKVKEFPGLALYPALSVWWRNLVITDLFKLPLQVIILMHTKVAKDLSAEARAAAGLDVNDKLVMDLGGNQSANLFRKQSTLITPLVRRTVGVGAAVKTEWELVVRNHPNVEWKCGYSFLADKEPANLRMLLDKIATNRAS